MMTGLHGIHILVGIGLLAWLLMRAKRGEFQQQLLHPGRPGRPVLALGRYDLDLSVPAVLPDHMSTHTEPTQQTTTAARDLHRDSGRAADPDRDHGGRGVHQLRLRRTW